MPFFPCMENLDYVKETLVSQVDIADVARRYGVPSSHRNTPCPLHPHAGDNCFSVKPSRGSFKCYSSHHSHEISGGDCVNLVRMMEDCSYVEALKILAEQYHPSLLEYLTPQQKPQRKAGNPALENAIRDLWKARHIQFLPESIVTTSSSVQYRTYLSPESDHPTALYQQSFPTNLAKRLTPKGEMQHELYVPMPWESYIGCQELFLVEGIPDTLTYTTFGAKAVGAIFAGSVDRDLFTSELSAFLAQTMPEKIVIVPDPDAYARWRQTLPSVLEGWPLEWIDLSLLYAAPTKTDSNALLQECHGNRKEFFRALSWCRRNSNPYQRDFGDRIVEKRENGYYLLEEDKDGSITTTRASDFTMFYRVVSRDQETQEESVEVTFQYDGRRRITKLVPGKVLGDPQRFKDLLNGIKHTCFFKDLKTLTLFEDRNRQYYEEVQSFEAFGQVTDDTVLFQNVAVVQGKAFPATKNDVIFLTDRAVRTVAEDAPRLTLGSPPGTNQKLILALYAAYGLNGILSLAFDLASIRMKSIIDRFGNHALKFLHGEPGIGKTKLETEIKRLFGIRNTMTARDTRPSLERISQKYQYLPIPLHEWKPEHEEATDFLEKAYDRHIKNRAELDNSTKTKNNDLSAFVTVTSNYVPTPKAALHTRNAYLSFQKGSFDKTKLNELERLTAQSDLVLQVYTEHADIEAIHAEARHTIEALSPEARTINNYAPFLVGLVLLKHVDAITEQQYTQFRHEFLTCVLPDTLSNITEDTMVEDFLQELHIKAISIRRTNLIQTEYGAETEYETEITVGKHYIIRQKENQRYLILDLPGCLAEVNRGHKAQFDKKVLQQALKDSPYFHQQPETTKYNGSTKYKAMWLYLSEIERRLGITFRDEKTEQPENLVLHDV